MHWSSEKRSSKILLTKILTPTVAFIDARLLRRTLEVVSPNESLTRDGKTALHLAAGIEHELTSLRALRVIMVHSVNPNIPKNDGETSMHVAAALGHKFALEFLICNGGNLLQVSIKGESPIDVSFLMGHGHVASFLTSILNFEEQESRDENFYTTPWNRQLLEFNSDFTELIPVSGECLLCKHTFIIKSTKSLGGNISEDSIFPSILEATKNDTQSFSSTESKTSVVPHFELFYDHMTSCYRQTLLESFNEQTLEPSSSEALNPSFLNYGYCCSFYNSLNLTNSLLPPKKFPNYSITSSNSNTKSSIFESFYSALSTLSRGSFVTIVEERLYTDLDEGAELIERITLNYSANSSKCASIKSTSQMSYKVDTNEKETLQKTQDSVSDLSESILGLSGRELRIKLKELGFDPGPVTSSTFRVLQRHFCRLRRKPQLISQRELKPDSYSNELEQLIGKCGSCLTSYEELEGLMCSPFLHPDNLAFWRNGTQKSSFNYLLLDPRITKNLSLRQDNHSESKLFKIFLSAVFYVGKGTRTRPYSHLYEAMSPNQKSKKNESKVLKIKSIWNDGLGVISLHVFQNVIPVEAWTREAAMISAIELKNLTNTIQGTFYGPASAWRKKDQRQLGSFCLYKAFRIMLLEGERQIRPLDLPIQKWMH